MANKINRKALKKGIKKQIKSTQDIAKTKQKATEDHIEKHLFNRFTRLNKVRRFVSIWIALVSILILGVLAENYALSNYFQKLQPVPGGVYNEGILGNFSTTNPIFATNLVDTSLSHLVFAPLLTYDNNNKLIGDLASSYDLTSQRNTYIVNLRHNLTWHDGQPLTAKDVVFTYNLIKNPDVKSPYLSYFSGVTIKQVGDYRVDFTLPSSLASFANYLTIGILPEHILSSASTSSLRSNSFNTVNPVGSGPFVFKSLTVKGNDPSNAEVDMQLSAFSNYALGKPKLNDFIVHAYASKDKLISAFNGGKLNAAEGLSVVPSSTRHFNNLKENNFILTAGSYLFYKNSNPSLSDSKVRSALSQAVDVNQIISSLGYQTIAVNEPLLKNMIGYNPSYAQAAYNPSNAAQMLDQAGWTIGSDGIRTKNKQKLSFNLTILNDDEYINVANRIKSDLARIGVRVNLTQLDLNDFTLSLQYHQYDMVLYSIGIGNDPDVFVYWASSQGQVQNGKWTNLSEYNNKDADKALDNARIRFDAMLRNIKYAPFLQAWKDDQPALGLYQPRSLYLSNGPIYNLGSKYINSPADRFDNVQNWEIHEAKVTLN